MKKLLAFILASIMVLSLVPASAFAAFELTEKCPSTHTLTNCENVFVKNVPATCTSNGYDVYACKKCGTQFYANVTDKAAHTWNYFTDKNHADKAATCTVAGYKWVKSCAKCSVVTDTANLADNGLTACTNSACKGICGVFKLTVDPIDHDYQLTGNGLGCETEYKCKNCNDVKQKDANGNWVTLNPHQYDYENAKVTKPAEWVNGAFVMGNAVVYCSVEGCPAHRDIDIIGMGCKHYVANVVQKFVEETCYAIGFNQVIECRDCKNYYVDANKNGKIDSSEDLLVDEDGVPTKDISYAIREQLTHSNTDGTTTNTITYKNCEASYKCVYCEQKITYPHHLDSDVTAVATIPATCTSDGYTYGYCTKCKQNITQTIEKLGHNTVEIIVEATCSNVGAVYEVCLNENCPLAVKLITDASSSAFETVYSYEKLHSAITARTDYAGYIYALKVFATKNTVAAKPNVHTLLYRDYTNNPNGEFSTEKPTTDCTGFKIVEQKCNYGCADAYAFEYYAAADHNEYIYQKYANCAKVTSGHSIGGVLNAYTERVIYKCENCDATRTEQNVISSTAPYATQEDLEYYHGMWYYEADSTNHANLVKKERSSYNAVVKTIGRAVTPTCTTTGYDKYTCLTCMKDCFVTVETVVHLQANGTTPKYTRPSGKSAATCSKEGVYASLTCQWCKQTVIENPITKEQVVVTSTTMKKHANTLKLVTPASSETECPATPYYQCTACNSKPKFTDWKATTTYKTKEANHDYVTLTIKSVANCVTPGYYEIRYCSDCGRYEINAYFGVNVTDRGEKEYKFILASGILNTDGTDTTIGAVIPVFEDGAVTYADVVIKADGTYTCDASLEIPAFGHNVPLNGTKYVDDLPGDINNIYTADVAEDNGNYDGFVNYTGASQDHTKPGYDAYLCRYCSYEYLDNYVADAMDHVNKFGEVLSDKCTDAAVSDNICIYCETAITPAHEFETYTPVPGNCVEANSKYSYCETCGAVDVIKLEALTSDEVEEWHNSDDAQKYLEIEGEGADYAHAGTEKHTVYCTLCEAYLVDDDYNEDTIEEAGLEIYLDVDKTVAVPGSTVAVTVSIDSLQGVNVWSLAFPVFYDGDVFELVEVVPYANSAFTFVPYAEVLPYCDEELVIETYQGVEFITNEFEDGNGVYFIGSAEAGTLVKGKQTLMTLYFKVITPDACTSAPFAIKDIVSNGAKRGQSILDTIGNEKKWDYEGSPLYKDDSAWVAMYGSFYHYIEDAKDKTYAAEAISDKGEALNVNYNDSNESESVTIQTLLDLNNDGSINLLDAYILYAYVQNPVDYGYNIRADINLDGTVTAIDLAYLFAIYSGNMTIEDIIFPDGNLPDGWYNALGRK